jgi:NADH-quinone oxidoreductase subunit N
MNTALTLVDFAAIGPLFILLIAGLLLLLLESFKEEEAKKSSFWIAGIAIVLALIAAIVAPPSESPLLTPWLRFDELTRFFNIFFLAIGLASACLAYSFFQRFEASRGEYYFLLLAAVFGLILIGASANFLTLFLGLESLSISLYILCGYIKRWENSNEAAIKYFLIGAVATAFLLYGIACIYGAVGTTSFNELLDRYHSLTSTSDQALFLGGIALVTLGLAFKAAIVPFHVWAPDVYDGAPMPVTAFMAVGTKVGAFAAFTRVFLVALPQIDPIWNQALEWLAIVTMIYANIVALRQVQLRRFFAYSGISHAGFLLIPIVADTPAALPALSFYLVIYSLATLGCFAILAFLDHDSKGIFMHDLYGLFRRKPFLAGIFALCLLTLAGIPPTAGFFAKFYVFKIAFQAGYYALVIVGLLTTILAIFYYLRIVSLMFAEEPVEKVVPLRSWPATLVGVASFTAILIFSFYPDPLLALLSMTGKT